MRARRGSRGRGLGGLLAAGSLALLIGAASAQATFPGRDGEILFSWDSPVWNGVSSVSGVAAYDPVRKVTRQIALCSWDRSHEDLHHRNCTMSDAATSPEGQSVAVIVREALEPARNEPVGYRLSVRDAGSGEETASVALPGVAFDPAWAPSGDAVTVTLYEGPDAIYQRGPSRLVNVALESGDLTPIAVSDASAADWSSRGQLAFVRHGRLWVATPGGATRRIMSEAGSDPSWSPDGRRLVFERGGQIWTVRVDGSRQRRVYRGPAREPVWSPDGARIAFLKDSLGDPEAVWTVRADGCRPRALVSEPGSILTQPSWTAQVGPRTRPAPSACARKAKAKSKREKSKRQRAKRGNAKRPSIAPAWSRPFLLAQPGREVGFPVVAASPRGHAVVVWYDAARWWSRPEGWPPPDGSGEC